MANRRVNSKTVARSVADIPGRQLTCRVHHDWPSEDIQDGKRLPVGVWTGLVDPDTDMWHLNDQCRRCGKVRYQEMPGRVYRNRPWRYRDPDDWVSFPEKFTSRDALAENITRNYSKLFPGVSS
jgi:hypothetical protein